MSSTEAKALRVEIADGIAEITMLGPGKGNAMGPDFFRELHQMFRQLDGNDEVRVAIIRGSGDHFCYGLDLMAMAGGLTSAGLVSERTKFLDHLFELQDSISSVARCRKPVIAAVHGWCIGGGVDLITACDIRICSAETKFTVREVRMAMVADIGTLQRLPWIIGDGMTRDLAMTGADFSADRALRIGLISDVYATPAETMEAARAKAREIAANPPHAVQGIKRVMNHERENAVRNGLEFVGAWNAAFMASRDLEEAMQSFRERRPPQYEGK